MDIYVGHSSSIDYEQCLYQPLKDSKLDEDHDLVFPHEENDDPFDSREFLKNSCDLFIAEVSEPSTGLGIELGWAETYDVPVVCVYSEGSYVSGSLSEITDTIREYRNAEELVELLRMLVRKY